jgi:hypothetical protein
MQNYAWLLHLRWLRVFAFRQSAVGKGEAAFKLNPNSNMLREVSQLFKNRVLIKIIRETLILIISEHSCANIFEVLIFLTDNKAVLAVFANVVHPGPIRRISPLTKCSHAETRP